MSLSCRASFVALFACPILWTLAAPGLAQERSEAGEKHAHGRPSHHVRGAYIICHHGDVSACHRELAPKHHERGALK
jgi:hypothetical protein